MDPEKIFTSNLDLIDRVIGSICRRNCVSEEEAEDFGSWAKLRLIDNDYGVFRKFQGRSSLKTYLTTVLHNQFRDYRIQKWGKWRPSVKARRMGEVAVQLDILWNRDGYSLHEAVETLRTNFHVEQSSEELEAMAAELPRRTGRRMEGEEALSTKGTDGNVETRVIEGEISETVARTEALLSEALQTMPAEDRLMLRMRYRDGFTIASIATALGVKQRPLYRRFEQSLTALRQELESRGLAAREVRELLGWDKLELQVDFDTSQEGNPPTVSV